MVGILEAGTPRGGYFGFEEGEYAFQHGQIGLTMQLIGIVVCLGAGLVTGLVTALILKVTIGLRNTDDEMAAGLDGLRWGLEPDVPTREDTPIAKG